MPPSSGKSISIKLALMEKPYTLHGQNQPLHSELCHGKKLQRKYPKDDFKALLKIRNIYTKWEFLATTSQNAEGAFVGLKLQSSIRLVL